MTDEQETMTIEEVEKVVELSRKIDDQNATIVSLTDKNAENEKIIAKQKQDIERLQKIIADNFVASKQKKTETLATKSFNDIYKEMIINNSKK